MPVSVPSASSDRPVPPMMLPVKLTSQLSVVVQVGSSAEPSKGTKSRSPFDALNVAVPENVFATKFTQCGYVAVNRPRCEPVPVNVSVNGTPSQGLGSPGVTSKVPAYLSLIAPFLGWGASLTGAGGAVDADGLRPRAGGGGCTSSDNAPVPPLPGQSGIPAGQSVIGVEPGDAHCDCGPPAMRVGLVAVAVLTWRLPHFHSDLTG